MAQPTAKIDRAREALARDAWAEAYDLFTALERDSLTPRDLEGLAEAAWWVSKHDESIAARQQAYAGYAAASQEPAAAAAAARLSIEHFMRDEPAVGAGWLARAQRHARDQPDSVEIGFLAVVEATIARFGGDLEGSVAIAVRASELGRRLGDPDLRALAIHTEGLSRIAAGEISVGIGLLDEAMTSVVAGELSAFFTGVVYCNVIEACLGLADIRRADEWSQAAASWCETVPPGSPYPGICRVNRAEVARLRGAWSEAETEGLMAAEQVIAFDPMAAASAISETGDIRRRMGESPAPSRRSRARMRSALTHNRGSRSCDSRRASSRQRRPRSASLLRASRDPVRIARGSSPRRWTSRSRRATSTRPGRPAPSSMRSRSRPDSRHSRPRQTPRAERCSSPEPTYRRRSSACDGR